MDPLLTDIRQASGWYAVLPEPAPAKRLKGHQTADWVVVGAGVTGLAAARRLGELAPEARVILIDDYRVGYGASARNAGFIIDTPHLTEQLTIEENRHHSRLVLAGTAELERHVRNFNIECEWSRKGHLTAVVDPKREKHLRATVRMLEAMNEECEWYDRDAIAKETGTDHYHAAVLTPRSIMLNPSAMCRGLGGNMPDNVEVHEESPARQVRAGSPVRIECAEGSISAKNVLLTTNAFITKLGYLKGSVFPLIGCGSLTRPLTEDEQASMGGEPEWGITGVTTVRRTLTNRILIRHGSQYTGDFSLTDGRKRAIREVHRESLKRRFPMLSNVEFEHTWAGVFAMTMNWASHFGQLEPGVFVALGYCGVGLPRGTASGTLLAEYAMGAESDLIRDVQAVSSPKSLPPKPFLDMGVHARLAFYRWSSRKEL
jgi:glycine/D-amino acid oxidase-like deaminating enzyme